MAADRTDPVVQQLTALGRRYDEIRAVVLTSNRATGACDVLSDYDVELFVADPARFASDDAWFESFGPVLVLRRLPSDDEGDSSFVRLVQYRDGLRIDFLVATLARLHGLCEAPTLDADHDVGYEVLLDKDGVTASLSLPTCRAYLQIPPSEAEYADCVNGFWWNTTYVPKCLWRGDVLAALFMLDGQKHHSLRLMLTWAIEVDHNWTWQPGMMGKGIEHMLDAATRRELAAISTRDAWQALFRTAALFRKAAAKVAQGLGYTYPTGQDERIIAYWHTIRALDRQVTSRDELARRLRESYGE
jgi:aminoglycoside 6-adenylyltransferase